MLAEAAFQNRKQPIRLGFQDDALQADGYLVFALKKSWRVQFHQQLHTYSTMVNLTTRMINFTSSKTYQCEPQLSKVIQIFFI